MTLRCLRPRVQPHESGAAAQPGMQPRQNVEVHVGVGDCEITRSLRAPKSGEQEMLTPESLGRAFDIPAVQVRSRRGCKPKVKASFNRTSVDPRIDAIGANDVAGVPALDVPLSGSNGPMP